jgi:predicted GNAT family N-acyltransferase
VFVQEQGIDEALEWDEADALSLHAVAYQGAQAIGTGRLLPDARIGRMAVLPEFRRAKVGTQLLLALIDAAGKQGQTRVELSAQTYVKAFYEAHGFVAFGPVYDDAGIPHQSMAKPLQP